MNMRLVTGSPVEGEDFFDREREQRIMWRKLAADSLLLLAPRRIGKTSLMRALCAGAPSQGFEGSYVCSFAPCDDEMDCIRELIKPALAGRSGGQKTVTAMKKRLKTIKSLKIGPFGIELNKEDEERWRDIGEAFAAILDSQQSNRLICVDEVPVFLLKLLQAEDGKKRVRSFLYWLRNLRQENDRNIRWVLAGSIGLDTVTARLGLGDTINDLVPVPLGAFDAATADRFLERLAASYRVDMSIEARSHLIGQLGWPVPYYLQVVFGKAMDLREADSSKESVAPIDEELIDRAFEELMSPAHKGYFDYWRQRLTEELGRPDDQYAIGLLNTASRDRDGVTRDVLHQALQERLREPGSADEKLRYLLDVLETDGYLVVVGDRYRFRLELLRRYWAARVDL